MDSHYALPIAFAAALHGALLFGFNKSPRVSAPKLEEPEKVWYTPILLPPDDPEIIVSAEAASKPTGDPEVPSVPISPEPPAVVLPTDFHLKPDPVTVDTSDITKIFQIPTIRRGEGGPAFDRNVISSVLLDNAPQARFQPAPAYPYEGKKEGLRGDVVVEFMVNESGVVIDPRIVRSSHRMFEDPSLRAVAKWKFVPGRRHGKIVPFRMSVPVVFNLKE